VLERSHRQTLVALGRYSLVNLWGLWTAALGRYSW